jgi:hypothetical protein
MQIPKPTKQKKVKKKAKKPDRKKLIKECLDLWSDCVIARDKVCRYTGDDTYLSAHHIRSVTHHSTMFDLANGITLSWRKVHFLQKINPERFQDMVIEIIGQEYYDEMKRKSLVGIDYTIADLLEIKEHLQTKLIVIKNGMDFNDLPF